MGRPSPKTPRHKYQTQFVRAAESHRTAAFFGGLQSGKSIAGADALKSLLYGTQDEQTGRMISEPLRLPEQASGLVPEVWILSKSYGLADQAWSYFRWRCAGRVYTPNDCKRLGLERGDSQTHYLRSGADGVPIRVRVRTARDPEQLRATGVLLAAWCDEIAHWPELAWKNLQGRGIVTPTRYLITTTPKGRNWLYRDVYLPGTYGSDSAIQVVTCRSEDNPWADAEYLDRLRRKFGTAYASQELDALFVESSGMVYSFDRYEHMRDVSGPFVLVVAGYDPGYGTACGITTWGKREDGSWHGIEEFKRAHVTSDSLIEYFRDLVARRGVSKIYVDKRRPSDYLLLRTSGLPAVANVEMYAESDSRTILPMVRYVEGLVRARKLTISLEMEETASEFESYHYPDREERAAGENPVKWMDDLLDSTRYAICSVDPYLPVVDMQRHRRGPDMEPKPSAKKVDKKAWRMPTVVESLAMQEQKMDRRNGQAWSPVR